MKAVWLIASLAALATALAFALWRAPAPEQSPPPEAARPGVSVEPGPPPTASSVAPQQGVEVNLYFPSRRYLESGDESLAKAIIEPHGLAPGTTELSAVARATLAALKAGPKSALAAPAIPERLTIKDVDVRDGVAHVDFSRAGLSGGSLEEKLLVRAIVQTLTQLPGVSTVQFLVEGKPPETLMGHVTTTEPIAVAD